jgi:hypothetical protein
MRFKYIVEILGLIIFAYALCSLIAERNRVKQENEKVRTIIERRNKVVPQVDIGPLGPAPSPT